MTIHDGDLSSVGNTITVWNNTATAITTGKYMQAKVAAGKLWADVVECST
jgi:head-tail adaptor